MFISKKLAIEKLREKTARFFALLFPDRTSLIIFLLALAVDLLARIRMHCHSSHSLFTMLCLQ